MGGWAMGMRYEGPTRVRDLDDATLDSFPAEVRVFTRRAVDVGVEVRIETDRHGDEALAWLGSEEQFRELNAFRVGTDWTFKTMRRAIGVGGIRGYVWREPDGRIRFVIESYCGHFTARAMVAAARGDAAFQSFKAAILRSPAHSSDIREP